MRTGNPTPEELAELTSLLDALRADKWASHDQRNRVLRWIRVREIAIKRARASSYEAGRIAALRAVERRGASKE